jgi:hypothetical protein
VLSPEWIAAGAELALATEQGAVMIGRKRKVDETPAATARSTAGLTIAEAIVISAAILSLAAIAAAALLRSPLAR